MLSIDGSLLSSLLDRKTFAKALGTKDDVEEMLLDEKL